MTWEIVFVLVVLVVAVTLFWGERFPPDQVALGAFATLLVGSAVPGENTLPTVGELLEVFANPAPLTVAGMFILSAALDQCGALEWTASRLTRLTRLGYPGFVLIFVLVVGILSAFINNTPVVLVFLPVTLGLSRSLGAAASKLLIPLSYAAVLGGVCTLMGTSTNILASGILEKSGRPPIGMFELTTIGAPMLVVGAIYLALFGRRLLPDRQSLTALLAPEDRKEFIVEAFVEPGSPIVGKSIAQSQLPQEKSVRVLEIIRGEVALTVDPQTTTLEAGDRLVLACRPAGVAHARSIVGLELTDSKGLALEPISAHEGFLVEGIIGPTSAIAGELLKAINFRQRYRVVVVAIHRRGVNLREQLDSVRLQSGDLLLMMGTEEAFSHLRKDDDILLLDSPKTPSRILRQRAPIVIGAFAAVILTSTFEILPIAASVVAAVAVLFLTGCIRGKEGYAAVEWSVLALIYGTLGLGLAMEKTGAADLVARGLEKIADVGLFPASVRAYVLLAVIYLAAMILTEFLSNNATVVLMIPIALSLAGSAGIDPRPLVIAVTVAASAAFATPIGYQTNTIVYGVAGYKFTDFTRIGLPLNLIYAVASIVLIPLFWKF